MSAMSENLYDQLAAGFPADLSKPCFITPEGVVSYAALVEMKHFAAGAQRRDIQPAPIGQGEFEDGRPAFLNQKPRNATRDFGGGGGRDHPRIAASRRQKINRREA